MATFIMYSVQHDQIKQVSCFVLILIIFRYMQMSAPCSVTASHFPIPPLALTFPYSREAQVSAECESVWVHRSFFKPFVTGLDRSCC